MNKLVAMILLVGLGACASLQGKEYGPWVERTVRTERMDWRWCTVEFDQDQYVGKGWCWQGQECRMVKRVLARDTQECRQKPYFCAFADVDCMIRNRFPEKKVR